MEGSPDLQKQLEDREAEVRNLHDQLDQAQEEIDRLRRENEQLRKELKAVGRGKSRSRSKRKAKPKRSGRKAGQGRFSYRGAPSAGAGGPAQPVSRGTSPKRCPMGRSARNTEPRYLRQKSLKRVGDSSV